jgi:hypothetical protein
MCYSIPLSWRNVFGGDYGELPIAWFYLFGLLLIIHLLSMKKDIKLNRSMFTLGLIIFFVILFSIIPLLITNSNYFSQGLSQFIILSFHSIIVLVALLKGRVISETNLLYIEKSYIKAGLFSSIGIIVQYVLFKFGTTIGVVEFFLNRQSFYFLFSEPSHASLYLVTTAFLSIQLLSNQKSKIKSWLTPIIILIGAAITSARTGLVVFFALYMMYIFVGQKGVTRKLVSAFLGVVGLFGAYSLYTSVRQQSGIKDILFSTSERDVGYEIAINMFKEKPLLGYGFSRDYISSLMGQPIPHFSFLQYLIHGGVFYTLMLFGVIGATYLYAKRNRMHESWLILLTVLGTCLIPDIFSTRYITLLMVLVFLKNNLNTEEVFESSNQLSGIQTGRLTQAKILSNAN